MSDPIIPIDNRIAAFTNHLYSHPRTILSARYGDGKSFFLSKFIKKKGKPICEYCSSSSKLSGDGEQRHL